ncbi:bombesin receptor-activated protein C6orf89 homolog [Stegastes partitus]|uniref:Bombesin receptor-activated protein C6orf89 homolog n=1 Tax=Stegastes partitus TaxID=144197 RepID=A0A9Y4NGL8_9TELE|nr:PREDICTED: bombesin receptor-activated protein C6orf89 homolog [Stegastes partitus]
MLEAFRSSAAFLWLRPLMPYNPDPPFCFHEWWSAGSLRQSLVNCSGCAEISSVLEVPESLRGTVTLRRGPQLVLLKGGESLSVQRQQLEELYLAHSGSMSILLEEDDGLQNHNLGLPQGPANFTLLWRFSSGTREKVLRWLFPKAELCPLLDSAGTILQRCLVTHSTNSQSKVSPADRNDEGKPAKGRIQIKI